MTKRAILLLEGNPDYEELTLIALRDNNISNPIAVVRDGQEALDYLFCTGPYCDRDPRAIPAIVLLDLKLPRIDGLEVLRRVRAKEQTRLIPVAILTSSDEDSDLRRSYQLGANSYIPKPVDFHQFSEAVRQLGLYWLVLNAPPPAKAYA